MSFIKRLINTTQNYLKLLFSFITKIFSKTFSFIHSKKRYYLPFYTLLAYILVILFIIKIAGDSNYNIQLNNLTINDVTQINPINVNRIIIPKTTEEIRDAILNSKGPISIGGGKFSMGGQTSFENSLHIDMRKFNKVLNIDTINKIITLQPGIIWIDLQNYIDKYNLSVKIMQTYSNFTVGGSISVNCHGRYIGHGSIISSIISLKVLKANGDIIKASRDENFEVFKAVVGGYGAIGVIVEATLQLTDNIKVERQNNLLDVKDYNDFFNKNIKHNSKVVFQNGDLYPPDYNTINNVAWIKTNKPLTDTNRLTKKNEDYWFESNAVELVSKGNFGKYLRQNLLDPYVYTEKIVKWRNKEASYDVKELEPDSRAESTYVLQEYFIPVNKIQNFISKMRKVFNTNKVNVLNVSLRHAYKDTETYLTWANEEVFAFVIYYKQGTDDKSKRDVKKWTIEMTDSILSVGGSWYLPYQPHASVSQFQKAYPKSSQFFEIKNKYDPEHRFQNYLLNKYNPYLKNEINHDNLTIKNYKKNEDQTFLTVPEWYLVFNPKEYADYLETNTNPSDFPFYESINEFWSLYDRSLKLTEKAYKFNEEYVTMLNVIGVSVTAEYTIKLFYENTIGRLFSYFHNGKNSEEEKIIISANRAYSNYIYDNVWYDFKFLPWINKVWSVNDNTNSNFFRKWERTCFFTLEFFIKAIYAQALDFAVNMNYSAPITDINLIVISNENIKETNTMKVVKSIDSLKILKIQRWGPFTENILKLAKTNIKIKEIAGNDEIVVSIYGKKNLKSLENYDLLYNSNFVTNNKIIRKVYRVPVAELLIFIKVAEQNHYEIEHVYDY